MKVLILSDARSVHTKRWVSSLIGAGVDVVLFSVNLPDDDFFDSRGIRAYYFDLFTYKGAGGGLAVAFVRHVKAVRELRRVLLMERPDVLHAHYLTSYCLVAAWSGFHPLVVSMWGSDVYEFPRRSFVNRFFVRYVLRVADRVLSTSGVMAREAAKYCSREILITPFGVDTSVFRVFGERRGCGGRFVMGTVKSLSALYGSDLLVRCFAEVVRRNPLLDCVLEVVGRGPQEEELRLLADGLGVGERVVFRGWVENAELPEVYNGFSVAVFLSRAESFGVAAVEAMACGCPVVVSDADGFTEVVEDGVCGFVVPRGDFVGAADAVQRFIDDGSLLCSMGEAARNRVVGLYDWGDCVRGMVSVYSGLLSEV